MKKTGVACGESVKVGAAIAGSLAFATVAGTAPPELEQLVQDTLKKRALPDHAPMASGITDPTMGMERTGWRDSCKPRATFSPTFSTVSFYYRAD